MLARINTIMAQGNELLPVTAEVTVSKRGFPGMFISGNAGSIVQEGKARILNALRAIGMDLMSTKIRVNLSPSGLKKNSTHFDLPIVVGILSSYKNISIPSDYYFAGELDFSGNIFPSREAFLSYVFLHENHSVQKVFIPKIPLSFPLTTKVNKFTMVERLDSLLEHLESGFELSSSNLPQVGVPSFHTDINISGQDLALRSLVIAAAGRHNLALIGPPGTGKTLLLNSYHKLLPPTNLSEAFYKLKMYLLSRLPVEEFVDGPTVMSPGHNLTPTNLLGSTSNYSPGVLETSHGGTLILDEFHLFSKQVIDLLRVPIESGKFFIGMRDARIYCNSATQLLISSNPCPCGYFGNPFHKCICSQNTLDSHHKKLSGPLIDRLDMVVNMVAPNKAHYSQVSTEVSLKQLIPAIARARRLQLARQGSYNSRLPFDQIRADSLISSNAQTLAEESASTLKLSLRGYLKLLRVARTLADLEDSNKVEASHLAEALRFRMKMPSSIAL